MIKLINQVEIGKIREAGFIISETLEKLKAMVEDGIATAELDNFARDYVRSRGGEPGGRGDPTIAVVTRLSTSLSSRRGLAA